MNEDQPNFKVTDRRLFNADGTPRDVPEEEKPEPPKATAPEAAVAATEAQATESQAPQMPQADFFFQAEDGIRPLTVTGVQTCALPISGSAAPTACTAARATTSIMPTWTETRF